MEKSIKIQIVLPDLTKESIYVKMSETIQSVYDKLIKEVGINLSNKIELYFNDIKLELNKKISDYNIKENSQLTVKEIDKDGKELQDSIQIQSNGYRINESFSNEIKTKEINIKFIEDPENTNKSYISNYDYSGSDKNKELHGLLKLSLLKEISKKISDEKIEKLSDDLSFILQILRNGYIESSSKKGIQEILKKMEGSNIINFSRYTDKSVSSKDIEMLKKMLSEKGKDKINDIQRRLMNYNEYMKFFEKDFEEKQRNSYFEFSIISLAIMERENLQTFEKERKNCPNRVDKILYHGTGIEPISNILTEKYLKSENAHYQHGKGVYFTDMLDYCWYYGGEKNKKNEHIDKKANRINGNKVPDINDTFTFIANSIYYNKNGFRKVVDYKYDPKKNEINFAYAKEDFSTIKGEPEKGKFFGTEYVIWELSQICPFIGAKLKREEYCVIWRDNNFSSKPVYNNKFDAIFKNFLNERKKYIEQYAEHNIYPCETTKEALELIRRKKYNKIILISNVGTDLGGKKFVDEARSIIGNNVIALFLAYNIDHLKWIKDYKNALFSNKSSFYEDYLNCFSKNNDIKKSIKNLKSKVEKYYEIQFNFDDKFLDFPNFKNKGTFTSLNFD